MLWIKAPTGKVWHLVQKRIPKLNGKTEIDVTCCKEKKSYIPAQFKSSPPTDSEMCKRAYRKWYKKIAIRQGEEVFHLRCLTGLEDMKDCDLITEDELENGAVLVCHRCQKPIAAKKKGSGKKKIKKQLASVNCFWNSNGGAIERALGTSSKKIGNNYL